MKNISYFSLFILLPLIGIQSCSSDNIDYKITDNGLKINATIHGRSIAKDSLILESIKIIDVNSDHSYLPYMRLWGIGQPEIKTETIKIDEYLEGWFLLNNDEIGLVFLSGHKKAIYIKTKQKSPRHVKIISKIDPAVTPDNRKTFSVLLGTNEAEKLKEKMEKEWN
ncbi:MAG: hypothetical protein COC01_07955 [Bacteroidetes bacterium]|nr:MAG: hypothetical protein COC01_07955 [Bacteroidota bacterium]